MPMVRWPRSRRRGSSRPSRPPEQQDSHDHRRFARRGGAWAANAPFSSARTDRACTGEPLKVRSTMPTAPGSPPAPCTSRGGPSPVLTAVRSPAGPSSSRAMKPSNGATPEPPCWGWNAPGVTGRSTDWLAPAITRLVSTPPQERGPDQGGVSRDVRPCARSPSVFSRTAARRRCSMTSSLRAAPWFEARRPHSFWTLRCGWERRLCPLLP